MATEQARATVGDLYKEAGKAELIAGKIIRLGPAGHKPGRIMGRITRLLAEYSEDIGKGEAFTSTIVFVVPELSSGRESFSPDAAFYEGKIPANPMRFIEGPPTFAVEVRSEYDNETEMAGKRADYFEAGTEVVWDVDTEAEVIHKYLRSDASKRITFSRGQTADAEPAVPGWKVDVDWIFS